MVSHRAHRALRVALQAILVGLKDPKCLGNVWQLDLLLTIALPVSNSTAASNFLQFTDVERNRALAELSQLGFL